MSSSRSAHLGQVRTPRPSQVSSAGFDYVRPPTSESHNSFVRTPFWVFLDSMEIALSQYSIFIPVEDSGCQAELGQVRTARPSQFSSPGSDYM